MRRWADRGRRKATLWWTENTSRPGRRCLRIYGIHWGQEAGLDIRTMLDHRPAAAAVMALMAVALWFYDWWYCTDRSEEHLLPCAAFERIKLLDNFTASTCLANLYRANAPFLPSMLFYYRRLWYINPFKLGILRLVIFNKAATSQTCQSALWKLSHTKDISPNGRRPKIDP